MTKSKFFIKNGNLVGFEIEGHTGFADLGTDTVCAAISSAAYMTANTVTEICGALADITEASGRMCVMLAGDVTGGCADVLNGFRLHMDGLADQYPRYLQIEEIEI